MGEPFMPTPGGDKGDPGKDKKFEIMPKPELQEDWTEDKTETENGQPLKHRVLDEKGNAVYKEDRWYQKGEVPSPETVGGHRQTFHTYDDQGRVVEEVGQTLSTAPDNPKHEQQWKTTYEHGEGGSCTETGEIETGKDAGHKWRKTKEVKHLDSGRKIVTEKIEILAQGKNPEKSAPGKASVVVKYFKDKNWLGEKTTGKDGEEYVKLASGVEELPTWE